MSVSGSDLDGFMYNGDTHSYGIRNARKLALIIIMSAKLTHVMGMAGYNKLSDSDKADSVYVAPKSCRIFDFSSRISNL